MYQDSREIVWPEKPLLRDTSDWYRNTKLVYTLCRLGKVTEWINGQAGKDSYVHMPYHFEILGVTVAFLPHWGFYEVGGISLSVPTSAAQVLTAVLAVKMLQSVDLARSKA